LKRGVDAAAKFMGMKTLLIALRRLHARQPNKPVQRVKVFCFFFSKKKCFLPTDA
jgi:hypothetical protein